MSAEPTQAPAGKFLGEMLDLFGLGKVELTHVLREGTETAIYQISHHGIVVKTFDLSCGKPGEVAYGPYMRFTLELANFEDIMKIESLRNIVPAYYGANVNQDKQYSYIAMEFLPGQDLQSWCEGGAAGGYPAEWVEQFKESIYETLAIMTRFHKHGMILVDFKPDNVIRIPNKGIKFVDLGAFFTPRHHRATDKYLYSATPDYAELLIDASNIETGIPPNEASDIFSVGVALFEMATATSRLAIQDETADQILARSEIYRFRDSQIRDLWHQYPHLKEVLPLVEAQLKERRILFSELWHLLKGYLSVNVPEWESLGSEQRDQIILTTGTTFIQEQLPSELQWLSGTIAQSTVLRSIRLKSVADLMRLIENPVAQEVWEDVARSNGFVQYVRDQERSVSFLERLNTWEVRFDETNAHWALGVPIGFLQIPDSAPFTLLKRTHTDDWGHKFYQIAGDNEADHFGDAKLTLWDIKDDHYAWLG